MIKVYKKRTVPKDQKIIRINDVYFNNTTAQLLDDRAKEIIRQIDESELFDKYSIQSRFDGSKLNIDKLSTGCKTVLNIMYNPDKIFDIAECGENALEVIYSLEDGKVYCDYPMIAFNMKQAEAVDVKNVQIFNEYEALRKWWKNEDKADSH